MAEESTTPDLVELTRRGYEALNRRDFEGLKSFFAPDSVWDLNAWGVGAFEGVASISGFFEDWLGNYEDYHAEAEQILDLGQGVVFHSYREVGRPLGSEGRIERRQAQVAVWEKGHIASLTAYADIDRARAAAERLAQERRR